MMSLNANTADGPQSGTNLITTSTKLSHLKTNHNNS